jgi:hypothetical protein
MDLTPIAIYQGVFDQGTIFLSIFTAFAFEGAFSPFQNRGKVARVQVMNAERPNGTVEETTPFPESKFPGLDTVIWRYVSIPSLVAMLQTSEVPFTRVDQFRDQHEAVISRPTLRRVIEEVQQRAEEQGMPIMGGKPLPDDVRRAIVTKVQKDLWEQQRKDFFVNCWHANAIESMAMWDLYSNKGVAIRSTVERLLLAFEGQAQACWVTYVDHGAEEVDDIWPFLFKRREYHHEHEIRAYLKPERRADDSGLELLHVRVKCNLPGLIEEVRLAPGSPDWLHETVRRLLSDYDLSDIPLVRSQADQLPDFFSELT